MASFYSPVLFSQPSDHIGNVDELAVSSSFGQTFSWSEFVLRVVWLFPSSQVEEAWETREEEEKIYIYITYIKKAACPRPRSPRVLLLG